MPKHSLLFLTKAPFKRNYLTRVEPAGIFSEPGPHEGREIANSSPRGPNILKGAGEATVQSHRFTKSQSPT